MAAYYNEIDPYAAQWLRNLIAAGHIAPGDVDERDIRDVSPNDLRGYAQCHFFAGIGVWSAALRGAGWPDDRPVWTGSCPCQPFSAAGAGAGFADERHLWPHWHHLIRERRPPVVFGEQVASKDGLGWLDLVSIDMEAEDYAFGAVDLCAAGVGAPHIRQRLWFVGIDLRADVDRNRRSMPGGAGRAEPECDVELSGPIRRLDDDDDDEGSQGHAGDGDNLGRRAGPARPASEAGVSCGLAHHHHHPERWSNASGGDQPLGADPRREKASSYFEGYSQPSGLVDADQPDPGAKRQQWGGKFGRSRGDQGAGTAGAVTRLERPGPVNGFWRDADWLLCRDGKWRPVRPGTFPLVDGAPSRVGRLRAYGNAIVREAAETFIGVAMESTGSGAFQDVVALHAEGLA